MKIYQRGYSCEEKLRIFGEMFFSDKEDVDVYSYFSRTGDEINVYTTIHFEGKAYFDDFYRSFDFTDERIDKKIIDAAVVKSFVNTAFQIRKINIPWGMMCGVRPAKMFRELYDKGYTKSQTYDFLKSYYYTCDEKLQLAERVSENEKNIINSMGKNSISLYIGIPFCPTRCLYCSFVSTDIRHSGKYINDFCKYLVEEIKKCGEIIKKSGVYVENIYIGGGTPTTLDELKLQMIYEALYKYIDLSKLREFTLEGGRPDTITNEKLRVSKQFGVNRLSINPQTLHDITLERIGRRHNTKMFYDAFEIARAEGFDNINTDVIAGLPGETPDMFEMTIDGLIKLAPEDITVHSMCVKRSADLKKKGVELTQAEYMNRMLSYAQQNIIKSGREPYYMYRQKNMSGNLENVGYAMKDKMSFYNVNIMEEVQTIIALGGGGSSKIVKDGNIKRIYNFKDPVEYIGKFDQILKRKDDILNLMIK